MDRGLPTFAVAAGLGTQNLLTNPDSIQTPAWQPRRIIHALWKSGCIRRIPAFIFLVGHNITRVSWKSFENNKNLV